MRRTMKRKKFPDYTPAEEFEFPPIPEDRVWCSIRGKQVGVSECGGDGCAAPETREVCWLGKNAFFIRHQDEAAKP
jgi:hypothetical protein